MPTIHFDRLAKIKSSMGDAALDPALWPQLMQDICMAVNTTGAALLQSDVRTSDIPMTESTVEIFKSYFDHNLHINDIRAARGAPKLMAGARVISDADIFTSETEMLRDPLYANLDNFGFRWWSAVGVHAGDALWALAFQRTIGEGMFTPDELAALGSLSDQLSATATLSAVIGRRVLTATTNALALVDKPAIAIDRFGSVLDINRQAEALFDDAFLIRNGALVARDRLFTRAMAALVAQMRLVPDHDELHCDPLVVRRDLRAPVVMRVLPVAAASRTPFLGARALLLLTEVVAGNPVDGLLLRRVFGMTPAESRIASLISTGAALDEIAAVLGIAHETVRSHLKPIFSKTGARRQPELVALLAQLR